MTIAIKKQKDLKGMKMKLIGILSPEFLDNDF
jgi:hypothetical protein